MGRSLLIVALVGLLMATGVAGAAPGEEVRLPLTLESESGTVESTADDQVVVVRGDHLWKISSAHLAAHAPSHRIGPYWLEVIEKNTPQLRSGDPDLIYPGEVIRMPAITAQP